MSERLVKVEFYLNIGSGEGITEVLEFPAGITDEELEVEFVEWRAGYIDSSWMRVEDKGDE